MSKKKSKNKKKTDSRKSLPRQTQPVDFSEVEFFDLLNETCKIITEENTTCLSSITPAVSMSERLTNSVEFWDWMNRNYAKSGHFASSESMKELMINAPSGQQGFAKKVVQGKGYEWDWMTAQRKRFENLFKSFDAGDIANRPGSDVTVRDMLTGTEKEFQMKAYTSKNKPCLKNTPSDMAVVTNAEKVPDVQEMGYGEVLSFGDKTTIEQARDKRLEDMASGKASPEYNIHNVGNVIKKAGIMGFIIGVGTETFISFRKWKNGDISTLEYLKEIMKTGGNTGVTSAIAAGIMIPISATITTAGISSIITIPFAFVISSAVDHVVAPAFARGEYKKILTQAHYYHSMTQMCCTLAFAMESASNEYSGFVDKMVSQQKVFQQISGTVISENALSDFEYFASLSNDQTGKIVSGMIALLRDTDAQYEKLKNQNWFQRMVRTVIGKNKATKEDIRQNHDRLSVYIAKAIEALLMRQRLDEQVLIMHGEDINWLCKDHVILRAQVEELLSWKKSIERGLLVTRKSDSQTVSIKQIVDDEAQRQFHEAEMLFMKGKLIDALPAFKGAAVNGVGRAYYYLGEYYINGFGHIKENDATAIEYWRKGMELGDPLSTYQYGLFKNIDSEYQCKVWIRKHIHSVLYLANNDDIVALYVLGHHMVNVKSIGGDLDAVFDAIQDSNKFFIKGAEEGYWPAAFMFYTHTATTSKSAPWIPDFSNLFLNVEWYSVHELFGMTDLLLGSNDFDSCAKHLHYSLWLREDKPNSAGFLAFLLDSGLVKDSISNGYSRENSSMYFNAGLKSNDEIILFQVGYLYFNGIGKDGIQDKNEESIGVDRKKAFRYFEKCVSVIENKKANDQPFSLDILGIASGLLGVMFLDGDGTTQNYDLAVKHIKVGYSQGDPNSLYLLAVCYKEGFGVKQDITVAQKIMTELRSKHIPGYEDISL